MKAPEPKFLVHITGPTAVGKTSAAIEVAEHFKTAIISCDSRQFFREMRIGTARPSDDELKRVKHYFIAHKPVSEDYNAGSFENDALKKLEDLFKKHDVVVMTGGSGLYLHAIWHGFDDELPTANPALRRELQSLLELKGIEALQQKLKMLDERALEKIDAENPVRVMRAIEIIKAKGAPFNPTGLQSKKRPFKQIKIVLNMDRELLYERINARVDRMMDTGLLEEAKNLLTHRDKNALRTVGYQELFRYFDGEFDLTEATEEIKKNTRRYAKRQLTWFRRYDDLIWREAGKTKDLINTIQKEIKSHETAH